MLEAKTAAQDPMPEAIGSVLVAEVSVGTPKKRLIYKQALLCGKLSLTCA
jgi:hypothetical protein